MRFTSSVLASVPLLLSLAPTSILAQSQAPIGCYSDASGFSSVGTYMYQTYSYCATECKNSGFAAWAIKAGNDCWCGNSYPSSESQVSDSSCSSICPGFGDDKCGGPSAWTVGPTGTNSNLGSSDSSGSSAVASAKAQTTKKPTSTSADPTVVTRAATIIVTAPGQTAAQTTIVTTSQTAAPKSSPNVAGIAAGVVVGVVVIAAIAGGLFLFLRQRKRRSVEEEYRQNAAAASTFPESKGPLSSAGSMSDSRLEPSVMMQRRQSDGSIADNQDYSRRILKVTNPDG